MAQEPHKTASFPAASGAGAASVGGGALQPPARVNTDLQAKLTAVFEALAPAIEKSQNRMPAADVSNAITPAFGPLFEFINQYLGHSDVEIPWLDLESLTDKKVGLNALIPIKHDNPEKKQFLKNNCRSWVALNNILHFCANKIQDSSVGNSLWFVLTDDESIFSCFATACPPEESRNCSDHFKSDVHQGAALLFALKFNKTLSPETRKHLTDRIVDSLGSDESIYGAECTNTVVALLYAVLPLQCRADFNVINALLHREDCRERLKALYDSESELIEPLTACLKKYYAIYDKNKIWQAATRCAIHRFITELAQNADFMPIAPATRSQHYEFILRDLKHANYLASDEPALFADSMYRLLTQIPCSTEDDTVLLCALMRDDTLSKTVRETYSAAHPVNVIFDTPVPDGGELPDAEASRKLRTLTLTLLANGMRPNLETANQYNLFHHFAAMGDIPMLRHLVEQAPELVANKDVNGCNALFFARDQETYTELMTLGVKPDRATGDQDYPQKPKHQAVVAGSTAKLVDALPKVVHPKVTADALPVITVTPFETLRRSILVLLRNKLKNTPQRDKAEVSAIAGYYEQVFDAENIEALALVFACETMLGIDKKDTDSVKTFPRTSWFRRKSPRISLKEKIQQMLEEAKQHIEVDPSIAAGAAEAKAAGAGAGAGAGGPDLSHPEHSTTAHAYPADDPSDAPLYPDLKGDDKEGSQAPRLPEPSAPPRPKSPDVDDDGNRVMKGANASASSGSHIESYDDTPPVTSGDGGNPCANGGDAEAGRVRADFAEAPGGDDVLPNHGVPSHAAAPVEPLAAVQAAPPADARVTELRHVAALAECNAVIAQQQAEIEKLTLLLVAADAAHNKDARLIASQMRVINNMGKQLATAQTGGASATASAVDHEDSDSNRSVVSAGSGALFRVVRGNADGSPPDAAASGAKATATKT